MGDGRTASIVDVKVGQRVRARRLEIGLSQERLAEILGVTFQQVQKYEKGTNRIAASRLFDISHALDIPVARFFEALPGGALEQHDSRKAGANDRIHDALATPEGVELLSLFATIQNQKVRRRVVELVRTLSEGDQRR